MAVIELRVASFFLGFLFVYWFRETDVCLIVVWEWKCGASRKKRIPFYFLKGMARVLSNNRNKGAFCSASGLSYYAVRQTELCFADFVV